MSTFKDRLLRVKAANFKRPYSYFLIIFSLLYLFVNSVLNGFFVIFPTLFDSNLLIIVPFLVLNLIVALLFGVVLNLMVYRFREAERFRKKAGLAPVGIFAGLLGGMCPGCFAGLFPSVLALFGISVTLGSLPLFGAEFLIVAIVLMLLSVYFLAETQVSCEIKPKKKTFK